MRFKVDENLPIEVASLLTEAKHDSEYPGVVVFRLDQQDKENIEALCRRLITTLENEELTGSLWIVEQDQVRIRRSDDAD